MGLLGPYQGLFNQVKATLQGVPSLKSILLGEAFRPMELPMAIITPREAAGERAEMGRTLTYRVNWETFILIRESEPENWFAEIIPILAEVHDAIMADDTLDGKAVEVTPTLISPGEITARNKLYYGGLIKFQAIIIHQY